MLRPHTYIVTIEAESAEDADKVFAARIDHDEDLREDGVNDYSIAPATDPCIVVAGNLSDGFEFHGPFDDFDTGAEYAEGLNTDSWVARVGA